MARYLSSEEWKPSEGFISTPVSERVIREGSANLSVLAGPGSGKTELLAQRANFLLQSGKCKYPQKILALSFKVDAATNIQDRVDLRCSREVSRRFHSSTFDAFFISLVRRFCSLLPAWLEFPSDFDVFAFDKDWWNDYDIHELGGRPFQYKSAYVPLDISNQPAAEIADLWRYCAEKKIADYSMCCSMALTLVKRNKQVRNLLSATYSHLFLDEFQDTTDPQYTFVDTVFADSETVLTAVGDSNQMIMGWAGANDKNFQKLQRDFDCESIPLAVNHRSNSKILGLINHVIADLTPPEEKPVVYEGTRKEAPTEDCIGARSYSDIDTEAEQIARRINMLMESDESLVESDFALILRQKAQDYFNKTIHTFHTNGLSLRNEDALVVKNGVKIQDLMSEPLSIFWTNLFRFRFDCISYDAEKELERVALMLLGLDGENERALKRLRQFVSELSEIIEIDSRSVGQIVDELTNFIGAVQVKSVFPQYRSQYLTKVNNSFSTLMQEAISDHPGSMETAIASYEGQNQVKLLTIHKSKGLEFDTVFFVDFNSDAWWALRTAVQRGNEKSQREEKNSFFVGLSRAENRLFFTKSRGKWPPIIVDLLRSSNQVKNLEDL
ncbi:MAG: ATP-dependent helicase [Pseudomonadales bacterium]|nr:ATP-dependent helicase [Pseudomonadales bacterium]